MKTFITQGYLDALTRLGVDPVSMFLPASMALHSLSKGREPTWVIGDPQVPSGRHLPEDQGRTIKIQAPFKFYAIKDRHADDCDCGCGGGSIVSFMLPHEY